MEGSIQVLLPPFLPKNKKEIKLKQDFAIYEIYEK